MFKTLLIAAALMFLPVTANAQPVPQAPQVQCVTPVMLENSARNNGLSRFLHLRGIALEEFLANAGVTARFDLVVALYHHTQPQVMIVPFRDGCMAGQPVVIPRSVFESLRGRVAEVQ